MKTAELSVRSKFKVVETPVPESHAYYSSQTIVETLNESIGDSFDEIIEDLVSPVS